METKTSNGIKIMVEANFLMGESNLSKSKYCHAYRVTIVNERSSEVQLLSRVWIIKDSTGEIRKVEGEGVVGQQPVIGPSEAHQYVSWCPLSSDFGTMQGHFVMKDLTSGEMFNAIVPVFELIYPPKCN
jgi:ApaG protein